MKVAALGDAHLGRSYYPATREDGVNQREADFEESFSAAVDLALEQQPDLIVWLGDIFDHPRPTYRSYRVAQRALARIRDHGVDVALITGNHDTPRLPGTGSPYSTLADTFPEFHFAHRLAYERFDLGPLVVHAVPQMLTVQATLEALERADQERSLTASNLLLTHPRVTQVEPRYADINEIEVDAGLLRSDFVLLGHYHFHTQVAEGIWYAGSTDTFSFADDPDKPKGVLVLDTDTGECRHLALSGQRPLITLPTVEALGLSPSELRTQVLERVALIPEGAVARLYVEAVDPEAYRLLDLEEMRAVGAAALQLKLEPSFTDSATLVSLPDLGSMPAQWDRYLEGQDLTGFDRDRLRQLGHSYLSQAVEKLDMRLTRLYLRNFRVYEEPVDLEMPPGLVGIFGRNGAGKSTLLESITWTLWGRARTGKDQIRTSGVNADCVTEVEFEHEGHLYVVRRTISGLNHTVKAEAHADGSQVAEGVRDVARYVHSVLGMDDVAFRASVFAEQKQLAAFSSHAPAERRKLVMQLLGITPLEGAREQSRRDAKAAADRLQQLRQLLPDRAEIERELSEAEAEAAAAATAAEAAEGRASAARQEMTSAASALETLTEIGHEYDALVKEGQSLRRQRDEAAERIGKTAQELATLDAAASRLVELHTQCAALDEMEARLVLVKSVTVAADALGRLPEPGAPVEPDSLVADLEAISAAAQHQEMELAETQGRLTASLAVRDQARQMAGRAEDLTGEADCPLCGQALGEAFEQVRAHRRAELVASESTVVGLEDAVRQLAPAAKAARAQVAAGGRALEEARVAWSAFERMADRRAAAAEAHQRALSELGRVPEPDEEESLGILVHRAKAARAESERLAGLLDARPRREADLAADTDRVASFDSELTNLRDKVRALGFKPETLEAARLEARGRADRAEAVGSEFQRLSAAAATALALVEGHRRRSVDADRQHQALAEMGEEARHLGRLADLLNVFRNNVVGSVGPTLSTQAAELFGELTDREYDRLEVDPDTYEIQIRDAGIAYGMDRYSGSETDLANLALRVAISEHVRFQSGGTVGLLVLDEVFGPLDDDRKERMLSALERLKGRFRQVLVVTHASEIKEQLPSAIEVVKLPGRRATARVVNP